MSDLRRRLTGMLVLSIVLFVALSGAAPGAEDPLDALGRAFELAASKAAPSVVQVTCVREKGGDLTGQGLMGNSLPPEFQDKFMENRRLFVRPEGPTSGVIIGSEGLVLTSLYNVAGKLKSLSVVTSEGRSYEAKILGKDPNKDLALLKIEARDLPALELFGEISPVPGQFALTLGRAADPTKLNLNSGIISAVIRDRGDSIQTSARVNYANSGGALVDISGRLIGIIAKIGHDQIRSRSGINTGVGFAAPVARIVEVIDKLKEGKDIPARPSPFLGIRFDPSYPASEDQKGVRIEYVYKGFPGKTAGLQCGDILLNFDHVDIESRNDLRYVISQCDPGQRVTFSILRGEDALDLEGVLTARPDTSMNALMSKEYLLWKAPRTLGIRPDPDYLEPGLFVKFVHAGFPLAQGGLRAGDVLFGAYGLRELPGWFPIFNLSYFDRTLQYCFEGAKVTFWVRRNGRDRMIPVIIGRPSSPDDIRDMDRVFEEVKDRLPAAPGQEQRKDLATAIVRWRLWVNLGVWLGSAPGSAGWEVDFVHEGLPGHKTGIRKGDFLLKLKGESYVRGPRSTRMRGMAIPASELWKNLGFLAGPMPYKLHWEKGDRWRVWYSNDGREKESLLTMAAYPTPAVIAAMKGELGGEESRLTRGEVESLLEVLRNRSASGRDQALRAFREDENWGPSAAETLVGLLDDRSRAFHRKVCKILKAHPSRDTLERVLKALPIDKDVIEGERWTDKAKAEVVRALLDKAELPGDAPDFGVNGKLWQRWWRENGDRIRFR